MPKIVADAQPAIDFFKSVSIPVFTPGDKKTQEDYEHAIATSNRLFRFCRPDCVVQPENTAQVQAIIRVARERGIRVTIKCGGHSYAGHSTAFDGISLDLRRMNRVSLDMDRMVVTMDAGCQWGHVYSTLINGRHIGYIINGGRCPTVGVSGFILGGGLGPFTRSFGMGCDTLMEATVVTAEGKVVKVGEDDPPMSPEGRLFWALRGAGGGNFGVVVEMKLKVQKLQNRYGTVVAGRYQWFPKEGFTSENLAAMNRFYTANWPRKMTIDSTWICDLRQPWQQDGVRFTVAFDGSKPEYDRRINEFVKHPELNRQLKRRVLPEPSTRFLYETLVNQWLEETERAYPTNKTYELYSSFVFTNDDKAKIQKITSTIRDLMKEFRESFTGEQVNFLVTWIHAGGRATDMPPSYSAYFWRQAVYHTYVTVEWVDKWMELDMRLFLAKVKRALRPLSLNGEAAFINFPDRDFPRKFHERAYFGGNREELRRVKEMWDKENFFKWVHGVKRPGDPDEDEDQEREENEEDRTDRLASEQWEHYHIDDMDKVLGELADWGF
ncbi:hypothetical protein VTH82DRAFT_1613 [Thermothelomyces myriococcoides]